MALMERIRDARQSRQIERMEAAIERRARLLQRQLGRSGNAEDQKKADQLDKILDDSVGRAALVEAVMGEFDNHVSESNAAIGDGEIFKFFLEWLQSGGAEIIGNLIKLIFALIGGLI